MSELIDREATVKQICKIGEMLGMCHDRDVVISIALFVQDDKTAFPTIEERPHGEWINFTLEGGFFSSHKCSNCGFNGNQLWHFCPSCGALMRVKYELNRVSKELNSEIENSDLPERFTATDCSCLNCKNRHSVHCEPQYKKIYGYCGNWERR